jgi:hypothetical protein
MRNKKEYDDAHVNQERSGHLRLKKATDFIKVHDVSTSKFVRWLFSLDIYHKLLEQSWNLFCWKSRLPFIKDSSFSSADPQSISKRIFLVFMQQVIYLPKFISYLNHGRYQPKSERHRCIGSFVKLVTLIMMALRAFLSHVPGLTMSGFLMKYFQARSSVFAKAFSHEFFSRE